MEHEYTSKDVERIIVTLASIWISGDMDLMAAIRMAFGGDETITVGDQINPEQRKRSNEMLRAIIGDTLANHEQRLERIERALENSLLPQTVPEKKNYHIFWPGEQK